MKIGIIGNMNNAYFSLTRYLRDEGYDCELLILSNEPAHFDPACDTFSTDYRLYCRHVNWGDPGDFLRQDFSVVKNDLSPYGLLIGNGPAPAYVAKIGRELDIFIPYGFDLYAYPFYRLVHPRRQLAYLAFARYQRRGIYKSQYMMFDRTNKLFEKAIERINRQGQRIVSPAPMIYYKDYENEVHQANTSEAFQKELRKLRQENELLFTQNTRQVWKRTSDVWSYKGNDLLFRGYAKFVENHPAIKVKLILFEYGVHVAESKKLIADLGIQDKVVWMPKMPRNQFMSVIGVSDLVIGELHHSWLTYGVAMEALCMGKPLLHKRIDKEFSADYPELYPMMHGHSSQSVYTALVDLATNRQQALAMGEKGREWFLSYCVSRPVAYLKKIIDQKNEAVNA